jgi:hypothetical protein
MAKHPVMRVTPPVIDDDRFNRNGQLANPSLPARVAEAFNFVSHRLKKQVMLRFQPATAVDAGNAAEIVFPCYFRTGEVTNALRVTAGLVYTDYGFASPPELGVVVKNSAGTTVTTKYWKYAAASAGGSTVVAPDHVHYVDDYITGLSANTAYFLSNEATNGCRVLFLSFVECVHPISPANDATTGVCNPGQFLAEHPIYDSHMSDLIDANYQLWRHNGSHLLQWTHDYSDLGTTPAVTATANYTNVIDAASTTVTTTTPGFNLYTQYHNTANRTTVPVGFAVKCARTVGVGTLDIKLTDGTNSISITGISGTPSPFGWTTATGTVPAQAGTKWDIQAKVSAGTYEIEGVMLWEYEA